MGEKQTRARQSQIFAGILHLVRDRRAVSAIEYGLLLVAILLLVAGGYRLLGKGDKKAAQVAEATLVGNADWVPSGGGSGDRGGVGNTPGGNSPSGDLCDGRSCGAPGSCFVAGTSVATPSGERPIESLHQGELVLARSADGDVEARPILRTFVRPARSLVDVHTVGLDEARERVRSTPEHPYFTLNHGWKAAGDLAAGETLLDRAGHELQVAKVVRIAQEAEVYNFEVDVDHTYFVGHAEVLVHNACGNPDFKDMPRPSGTSGTDAVKAEKQAVEDAKKAANDAKKAQDQANNEQKKADNLKARRDSQISTNGSSPITEQKVKEAQDKADQKAKDAAAAQANADKKKADAEALAPAAETQHVYDTLDKIPKPTASDPNPDWGANAPPGKMGENWGVEYSNNGEELPPPGKAAAGKSPYREYRVDPGGTDTSGKAGNRRVVIDTRNGDAYYTWTHYGSHGDPAFVKIRNGWP